MITGCSRILIRIFHSVHGNYNRKTNCVAQVCSLDKVHRDFNMARAQGYLGNLLTFTLKRLDYFAGENCAMRSVCCIHGWAGSAWF